MGALTILAGLVKALAAFIPTALVAQVATQSGQLTQDGADEAALQAELAAAANAPRTIADAVAAL